MLLSDFDFELPGDLIAKYPLPERSQSRLLHYKRQGLQQGGVVNHRQVTDLVDLVRPEDLLVFNNTRVIPARLFGAKLSGGRVEILVERVLDSSRVLAHVKASKSPKPGGQLSLETNICVDVLGREGDLFELKFSGDVLDILNQHGHMPLPPYIDRADELEDRDRYQTVYAECDGAVAAPTAGLHFDEALLSALKQRVDIAYVTLHVGAGTFQPVRVDDIKAHKMHAEYVDVSTEVCDKIHACKARSGRVIAVGTTSVRSLESAAQSGGIEPCQGDTDIFIYPGYKFKCVDAMVTNFHLPKSTLLMLVSAFSGRDNMLDVYHQAIEERYRFFSYGDAMFIE